MRHAHLLAQFVDLGSAVLRCSEHEALLQVVGVDVGDVARPVVLVHPPLHIRAHPALGPLRRTAQRLFVRVGDHELAADRELGGRRQAAPLAFFGEDGGELDQLLVGDERRDAPGVGQARRAPHGDLGLTGGPDGWPRPLDGHRRSQEVVDDEVRTLVAAPAPDHMARITSSDSSNRATRSSRFTPNALNS